MRIIYPFFAIFSNIFLALFRSIPVLWQKTSTVSGALYRPSLFVVHCGLSEKLEHSFSEPGVLPKARLPPTVLYKETSGSPKFPDYPFDYMPCSQTPVVS